MGKCKGEDVGNKKRKSDKKDAGSSKKVKRDGPLKEKVTGSILDYVNEHGIRVYDTINGDDITKRQIERERNAEDIKLYRKFTQLDRATKSTEGESIAWSGILQQYKQATPVQACTWPLTLAGHDIIACAETGSGKTYAFGVNVLQRVWQNRHRGQQRTACLIVAPTRELAVQTHTQLANLNPIAPNYNVRLVCVYGGGGGGGGGVGSTNANSPAADKLHQAALLCDADVCVATPGRLHDIMQSASHCERNPNFTGVAAFFKRVNCLVIDEADRLLDQGFEPVLRSIWKGLPDRSDRQTLMFTATWPTRIQTLACTFLRQPIRVVIGSHSKSDNTSTNAATTVDSLEVQANPRIEQRVYVLNNGDDKMSRLRDELKIIFKQDGWIKCLVFCLYKKEAERVTQFLRKAGFPSQGIHGDMPQAARFTNLEAFRNGSRNILVATDVAARGLDIQDVGYVINVTFPLTIEDYVHRIGRTGRAGKKGIAITYFTKEEKGLAGALVNVLKGSGQNVPEDLLKFGTTVKRKPPEKMCNLGHISIDIAPSGLTTENGGPRRIVFDD